MKNLRKLAVAAALAVVFGFGGVAEAITVVDIGTGVPPAALGPFTVTPAGDDARPVFVDVSFVSTPLGDITFDIDLNHREIGAGWATWSHGYTGDVYYTSGGTSVVLTLPVGMQAFYFYAEPEPFALFTITAIANDGSGLIKNVDGFGGATGYGFWDASGIASISITSSIDFAIGEFGFATPASVPEPGTVLLLGLGLAAVGLRRRS